MTETINVYPLVSICTPTFNRRPFIPYLIKCIHQQTYPQNFIEWIIVDDGTDHIEDLVKDIPIVKYFKYTEKMTLAKKRNIHNDKCSGDIIIYMDDDDYYPPSRITSAVYALLANPTYLIAGCLELPIYYHSKETIYIMGPYGENRITAASFAFRRQLLDITRYNDTDSISEEKFFLQNYTIPIIPLNPVNTILVVSHPHNTIDKTSILSQSGAQSKFIKASTINAADVIQDPTMYDFYITRLYDILHQYESGNPSYKPDVLLSIKDAQISRLTTKLQLTMVENERLTNLNSKLRDMILREFAKR